MGLIPWAIAFVDLDRDGRPEAIASHGYDNGPAIDDVGPEWTTAHWNGGAGCFLDVTDAVGLHRDGQWRALGVGDLDGDGDADLALGGMRESPRVYRNDMGGTNGALALRLRGTTSNHLGVGATIEVQAAAGGPTQLFLMGGYFPPLVVMEPLVFVGLGAARDASLVRITWPSGTVQEVRGLAAGALHTIEEPPLIAIDPPGRHLPVGEPAVVRVTPRALDGTVRRDAEVGMGIAAGGAQVASVTAWDEATQAFVIYVVGPAAAGSSVIEVFVDGEPVPIRPRLWWD